METIHIQVINQKAVELIHDLEERRWIKVLEEKVAPVKMKLSEKYRGIFTKEDARSFNEHVQTMRNEWDDI